MGGAIKKRGVSRSHAGSFALGKIQQVRSFSSFLLVHFYAHSILHTSQQFCEQFCTQLTEDNLRNLSTVFRMIDTSSHVTSNCLYKYMHTKNFKKLFKAQLEIYQQILRKQEKSGSKMISTCLKNHCFAILHTYTAMVEHINEPIALDNILTQIAVSHCFIREVQVSFTLHTNILQQFIIQEFGRYTNRRTRKALKRYLRLINERLQFLIQHCSKDHDTNEIVKTMECQKDHIKKKIDQLSSFNEIYVNSLETYVSDFSLVTGSTAIFPGTSTGGRRFLDRKSK